MAFIEPRLIHLLNDSTTPHLGHTDLPPFTEGFPETADRPSPLEPASGRRDEQAGAGLLNGSHATQLQTPGAYDDGAPQRDAWRDGEFMADRGAMGNVPRIPLRLLLGETDAARHMYASASGLEADETPESNNDDHATKKRHRAMTSKDDMMHLPQPVKKQKAASQTRLPPMPPIINGLHEPPPNAALFPPISSTEFDNPDGAQRQPAPEPPQAPEDRPAESDPPKSQKSGSVKTRKKAMKPRRKWSELETTHLLLGVNRHGVGKWTDILADPEFDFNSRTAGDLKDRFRTCCPTELRKSGKDKSSGPTDPLPTPPAESKSKAKTGLLSENILIEPDRPLGPDQSQSNANSNANPNDADTGVKHKKSRAHRKKLEDLAELGIHGPFKKSHRRERRAFSEQDDRQILEGLDKYGPAWTKIQRDSRFSLSGRQPTDLRDRVRNKYPDVYQRIEKGLFLVKEQRESDPAESVTGTPTGGSHSQLQPPLPPPLPVDPALVRTTSREELSRWPLAVLDSGELPVVPPPFDLTESSTAAFMGSVGEMDISRLLLDDSQISHLPVRHIPSDSDLVSL